MPLSLADTNKHYIIQKICGSKEQRQHLETLGFVKGEKVMILSKISGYFLVSTLYQINYFVLNTGISTHSRRGFTTMNLHCIFSLKFRGRTEPSKVRRCW